MKYGIEFPFSLDARSAGTLAREAELAGWDGVFVWEGINHDRIGSVYDAWIALAAIALATEHITIGTFLTPVPRRRPWELARETMTLDHLSNGRLVMSAGLGSPSDGGVTKVAGPSTVRERADLLDEGLELLTAFWTGERVTHHGAHYDVDDLWLAPASLQQPRIPIWVAALLGSEKSMGRAFRYDGMIPQGERLYNADGSLAGSGLLVNTPEGIAQLRARVDDECEGSFDIVIEGEGGDGGREGPDVVAEFADAGATWWMEAAVYAVAAPDPVAAVRHRIAEGPPRPSSRPC